MKNVKNNRIIADGKEYNLIEKSDRALIDNFECIRIDLIKE